MFRKLVENIPFSPALVGQLGFYARRLKQEEATRRLGLVFTALALIVQSFAVFSPPQNANAANNSDMIRGGISSKQELLRVYDESARGNGDFKDIMDYAGVTRRELATMTSGTLNSRGQGTGDRAWQTWGRTHRFSAAQGEVRHNIPRSGGGMSVLYSKPLWLYDSLAYTKKHGSSYEVFFGYSKKIGRFAIVKDCGNLVTTTTPKPAPKGAFLTATCDVITGYAYDARNRDRSVKIYLYYGGPPGKGDRSRAIQADLKGNKFKVAVPERYRKNEKPTKVWGVLVPLPGWSKDTVQFSNTATIPGGCVEKVTPSSACTDLDLRRISRTSVSLIGRATATDGGKINAYRFEVRDANGAVVASKRVATSSGSVDSGVIQLTDAGAYQARLTVETSLGLKTDADCATAFKIAAPEQCPLNPELLASDERCEPCPGNPQLWVDSPDCQPETVLSKTGRNLTQSADADATVARASDRIEYTIYAENTGHVPATLTLKEELEDVLEYARLQHNGGGTFNRDTQSLSWGEITLQPGETQSRTFVVQLLDHIPASPQGKSEPGSYDCIMTNAFGNTISTEVDCTAPKLVEQTVKELPKTGPAENMLFAGGLLAVVTYFWARSRQLGREVRLIRKDVNAGVI